MFNNREFLWVIISFILENLTRGALGSIRNRKTKGKKIIQSHKKIQSKPKTACKTVKTDKFSHPKYQNPNRSDTEVTNGAKRGFAAMLCVAWRRKLPLRRKRNCGTQKGKTENHIGYQIQKPKSIFDKNRRPNAKNRKMRKPQ